MRFSVIVSTYNRGAMLRDCLLSLQRQTHRAFEAIVVRGPCTDDTDSVLAEFSGFAAVEHCDSVNLSRSRNIGIARAAGDVCAFIDDDAVAHPRWLERLARSYADQEVGAAGGFTVDHTGAAFQCRYTVCDRFGNATFPSHTDPAALLSAPGSWTFPSLLGTNCSARTALLDAIGGFDETFAYMLDETDVCLRIFDLGRKVVTVPDALVFHRYAPSHVREQSRVPKTLLASSLSKAYFCAKHRREAVDFCGVAEELRRYRTDIAFSNRWYADRNMISGATFLRLNDELDRGILEGMTRGLAVRSRDGHLPPPAQLRRPAFSGRGPLNTASGKPPLRVALVSQGYAPEDTAGIARWTGELASGLASLGHEVHVITAAAEQRTVEYRGGVWVHAVPPSTGRFPPAPVPLPDSTYARALAVYQEALRVQETWGLDVLSAPIWDVEGIVAAAHLGVPVITSLHTTYRLALPYKTAWHRDEEYRANHVDRIIAGEEWLLGHSAAILGNSRAIVGEIEAEYGLQLPSRSVRIVPHGVDGGTELPEPRRSGDAVRLLFVGRIERRKGIDVLLSAMEPLLERHPNLVLDVVGGSVPSDAEYTAYVEAMREGLERTAPGRVRFRGYVDDEQLVQFYRDCDVFVVPSRFESFGLIAIEAMRFGKPVIASAIGGLREIVEDGKTGLLFPIDSVSALRQAISKLVSAPRQRAQLGRAAHAHHLSHFTTAAMAAGVEAMLDELVRPAPAGPDPSSGPSPGPGATKELDRHHAFS